MKTVAEKTPGQSPKRTWVKPLVETVELRSTDDVLGECWASSTLSADEGMCNFEVSLCYIA